MISTMPRATMAKHQPHDGVAEVPGHTPEDVHVGAGPLERRRQLLLQSPPTRFFPREGKSRVKELDPARVVVADATDQLVEDVEAIDPECQDGPAQRRPVVEDVVGLAAALVDAVHTIGGRHRGWPGHGTRTRNSRPLGVGRGVLIAGRVLDTPARRGRRVLLLAVSHGASSDLDVDGS